MFSASRLNFTALHNVLNRFEEFIKEVTFLFESFQAIFRPHSIRVLTELINRQALLAVIRGYHSSMQ